MWYQLATITESSFAISGNNDTAFEYRRSLRYVGWNIWVGMWFVVDAGWWRVRVEAKADRHVYEIIRFHTKTSITMSNHYTPPKRPGLHAHLTELPNNSFNQINVLPALYRYDSPLFFFFFLQTKLYIPSKIIKFRQMEGFGNRKARGKSSLIVTDPRMCSFGVKMLCSGIG